MFVLFPKTIARPIRALTESIIEVSNQNYDNRLNSSITSEFDKVADSLNGMTEQLATYRKSSPVSLFNSPISLNSKSQTTPRRTSSLMS